MFATNVRALEVSTKKILTSASAKGEGVASILKTQIDALSREISRGAGLSERKIEATQVPISERERLFIESSYARSIEQNPQKSDSLLEQIVLKYPKEIRARGNLAGRYHVKRMYDKAINEFNQILALNDRRLIPARFHYRLAKLYEQTGKTAKAIERYERFLNIWKSADKDWPEPSDAKARLAMLKRARVK